MLGSVFSGELTSEDILNLDPRQFRFFELSSEDIEKILMGSGAYWFDKNPPGYHALLTSGKHSNGYINLSKAYQYVNVVEILGSQLAIRLKREIHRRRKEFGKISRIVSPFSVAHLSQSLARDLYIRKLAYFEKNREGEIYLRRFDVDSQESVMIFDDLTTTGKTIKKMWLVLSEIGVKIFPAVGVIVYRPPPKSGKFIVVEDKGGKHKIPVISLVYKEIAVFNPEDCPWCKKGSVAVRPKENWEKLVSQR